MTQLLSDIRPYSAHEFKAKFTGTQLHQIIEKEFDQLVWNFAEFRLSKEHTPRQAYGDKKLLTSQFTMIPFYYLEFLTQKNPKTIYDLGCGWNIFKKYIPSIVGIGAEDPNSEYFFGDVHDYVDEDFIRGHQNYFESAFSICALHFVPMSNLRQRVLDFASMIKPSGRGWLALNAMRMLERDENMQDHPNLESWIRSELCDLPFTVLSFQVDLEYLDNFMDGNINLVFEK